MSGDGASAKSRHSQPDSWVMAEHDSGVLLQNFQTKVYCLRSIFLSSEVYFLAQYQYIYAIFIVVLAMAISPNIIYIATVTLLHFHLNFHKQ